MNWTLRHGDARDVLALIDPETIDAVVTDPPYGLNFMGKKWDTGEVAFDPAFWALVLAAMKPGAHLVAFGGTRTYHRLAAAIEDAGFEIRDQLAWVYGCGFPKSHNLSGGKGTALKPAWEPIVLARKPFRGTVAGNVLAHGTGALNIDACRIGTGGGTETQRGEEKTKTVHAFGDGLGAAGGAVVPGLGRWPANIAHDGNQFGEASRFFYSAKATKADRWGSRHPTVKPVKLKRWLVRLITPPGGVVLDPFAGSGTTGAAALAEGRQTLLIEREAEYAADIERRLSGAPPRTSPPIFAGGIPNSRKRGGGAGKAARPLATTPSVESTDA